jgi:hypothetical protein
MFMERGMYPKGCSAAKRVHTYMRRMAGVGARGGEPGGCAWEGRSLDVTALQNCQKYAYLYTQKDVSCKVQTSCVRTACKRPQTLSQRLNPSKALGAHLLEYELYLRSLHISN